MSRVIRNETQAKNEHTDLLGSLKNFYNSETSKKSMNESRTATRYHLHFFPQTFACTAWFFLVSQSVICSYQLVYIIMHMAPAKTWHCRGHQILHYRLLFYGNRYVPKNLAAADSNAQDFNQLHGFDTLQRQKSELL